MPRGSGLKIKTQRVSLEGQGQAVLSKTSLNRRADKAPTPPPPRVRQAFHGEVRVQPYSKGHYHEWREVYREEAMKNSKVKMRKCD